MMLFIRNNVNGPKNKFRQTETLAAGFGGLFATKSDQVESVHPSCVFGQGSLTVWPRGHRQVPEH